MKLLKSTLLIITLLMMQSASARPPVVRGRTASTAKKAPARTRTTQTRPSAPVAGTTFKSLMQKVRTMKPADVINSEGVFTDTFENMVKSSELAPELMEALFQAGRNLYLPLSGENEQDMPLLVQAEGTIKAMDTRHLAPIELEPLQEDLAFTDIEEALYYDEDNAMLKQSYLEQRIKELLQTKGSNEAVSILENELGQKMRRSWADHKIGSISTRIKELNKQIIDTVKRLEPRAIRIKKSGPVAGQSLTYISDQQAEILSDAELTARKFIRDNKKTVETQLFDLKYTGKPTQITILNIMLMNTYPQLSQPERISIIHEAIDQEPSFHNYNKSGLLYRVTDIVGKNNSKETSVQQSSAQKSTTNKPKQDPLAYVEGLIAKEYLKPIKAAFNIQNGNITFKTDTFVAMNAIIISIHEKMHSEYPAAKRGSIPNVITTAIFGALSQEGKLSEKDSDTLEKWMFNTINKLY